MRTKSKLSFFLVCILLIGGTAWAGNGIILKDNALFCLNKRFGTISVFDADTLRFKKELFASFEPPSNRRVYPQHIWEQGGKVYILFDACWCQLDTQRQKLGPFYEVTSKQYILGNQSDILTVNYGSALDISVPDKQDLTSVKLLTKVPGVHFNHLDYDGKRLAITFRPCLRVGPPQNPPCDHIVRLVDLERNVSGEYWLQNNRIKSATVQGSTLYLCCEQGKVYRLSGCEVDDGTDPDADQDIQEHPESEINTIHDLCSPSYVHSFVVDFVPFRIYATRLGVFIYGRKDQINCFFKADFDQRKIIGQGPLKQHQFQGEMVKVLETQDGFYFTTQKDDSELYLYRVDPLTGKVFLMESMKVEEGTNPYSKLSPELCLNGHKFYFYEHNLQSLKLFYVYPTDKVVDTLIADPQYAKYVGKQSILEQAIREGWISSELSKPLRLQPEDPHTEKVATFKEQSLRASRLCFLQAVENKNRELISQYGQQLEKFGDQFIMGILNDARARTSMWKKIDAILAGVKDFFSLTPDDELKARYSRCGPLSM